MDAIKDYVEQNIIFLGHENALLITIAPELHGALDAIKDCVEQEFNISRS